MSTKICMKCKSDFKYTSVLKKHMLTSARCKANIEDVDAYINTLNTKANIIISCNECKKIFNHKNSLIYHNSKSKCSKIQASKEILSSGGKLTIEQIKLLYPESINKFVDNFNASNNNITENATDIIIDNTKSKATKATNNITNNNTINNIVNQNITINQPIINIINPFSQETIPNLTFDKMMRLLNTVDKPEIEILKLVYSDIQNNNFFKYNMGKQDVSYLTSNNSIDTVQEEQFRQQILKNGKDLLKTMLLICTKELTIKDLSRIYIRIDNIETMLKEAVYDIDLTNYLYTYFRQHSKNTKKKLTTFVSTINDNPEIKEKFNKTLEDNKIIKYRNDTILTPNISLSEINKKLGDLTLAKELDFETTVNDFLLKKFEDTSYYKYMKLRIKHEAHFIKTHSNSSLGDHIELNKREKLILDSLDKMKELHTGYKKDDLLLIEIPQVYKTEAAKQMIKV